MVARSSVLSGEYLLMTSIGVPNEGYTFSGWEATSGIGSNTIKSKVENYKPIVDPLSEGSLAKYINPRRPLLERNDSYSVTDWGRDLSALLDTQTTYYPASVYSGKNLSPLNMQILFNDEIIDVVGVSSTLKAHFSKRTPGVTQIQYVISSLGTSAYTLQRADNGQSLNCNERWFENVLPGGASPGDPPNLYAANTQTSGMQHNPTRGGATSNQIRGFTDREMMMSIPIYRNWFVSSSQYVFDSSITPFDFISFSGETAPTVNQDKGGDFRHPALWKNAVMHERVIFNYSGIEGVCYHQYWSYFPKVPSGPWQQNVFDQQTGPGLTNIYNEGYFYNPVTKVLKNLDTDPFTNGYPSSVGAPYFSATVSGLFSSCSQSLLSEINEYESSSDWVGYITRWDQTQLQRLPIYQSNTAIGGNTFFPDRYGGIILEKNSRSWASGTSPYCASGPMAFGCYWKMASPAGSGHINGLSGDYNRFDFLYSRLVNGVDISANTNHEPVQNAGSFIQFWNIDTHQRVLGWTGHHYWFIYGSNKTDVKNKIDLLHSLGVANNRPDFSVPAVVAKSVVPLRPYG